VVGALASGLSADLVATRHLIWVIFAVAALGGAISLALQPLDKPSAAPAVRHGAAALFRSPGFVAIIAASALIQGSHAAYYTFASITWQLSGLGGVTIAALWALGVLAEIVVFAASPRLTLQPSALVIIGGLSAVARWLITAQEPPLGVLALVQLTHGLTFGLTQVGIMGLMVRHVPVHVMARGQGYLAAFGGIIASIASILSGAIFARHGPDVYYLMAAMALLGAAVIWVERERLMLSSGS
jgi:PPP family 3-phenylpropionic acid transporter